MRDRTKRPIIEPTRTSHSTEVNLVSTVTAHFHFTVHFFRTYHCSAGYSRHDRSRCHSVKGSVTNRKKEIVVVVPLIVANRSSDGMAARHRRDAWPPSQRPGIPVFDRRRKKPEENISDPFEPKTLGSDLFESKKSFGTWHIYGFGIDQETRIPRIRHKGANTCMP